MCSKGTRPCTSRDGWLADVDYSDGDGKLDLIPSFDVREHHALNFVPLQLKLYIKLTKLYLSPVPVASIGSSTLSLYYVL